MKRLDFHERGVLRHALLAALLFAPLVPSLAHACACGCGVFEVGTPAMFPTHSGGMLSLEYDFMDQDRNWSGAASAPASDNADRRIRTHFVTAGVHYAFHPAWSASVEVPYWSRMFRTTDDDTGEIDAFTHGALGDVRVSGTFTGFSPDRSTGVSLGIKLPTGDHEYANFDRDTEIGTGSTDALLGAYHVGSLGAARTWTWYLDGQYALPFAHSGDYEPGSEGDAAASVSYTGWKTGGATLAPMLGLVGSVRARDAGSESDPDNSGYQRVLLAPGLDARFAGLRATLTVHVPLYEHVNGDQLVAPALFKLVVGHAL